MLSFVVIGGRRSAYRPDAARLQTVGQRRQWPKCFRSIAVGFDDQLGTAWMVRLADIPKSLDYISSLSVSTLGLSRSYSQKPRPVEVSRTQSFGISNPILWSGPNRFRPLSWRVSHKRASARAHAAESRCWSSTPATGILCKPRNRYPKNRRDLVQHPERRVGDSSFQLRNVGSIDIRLKSERLLRQTFGLSQRFRSGSNDLLQRFEPLRHEAKGAPEEIVNPRNIIDNEPCGWNSSGR